MNSYRHEKLTTAGAATGAAWRKIFRVVKLMIIFLLAACMAGARSNSQVTLSVKNAVIEEVFQKIHSQTGYHFVYANDVIQSAKPISITVKSRGIEDVLQLIFKDQPLKYSIIEKVVVVQVKELPNQMVEAPNEETGIDVRGRIVNESGEPVAGASVMVKGTKVGTTTNAEGYFELKGVEEDAVLVISGVSIDAREVKVNGRSDLATIGVMMKITMQEEVVVKTNYYSTTKRLSTGNISKVTSKTIEMQPVTNVLQAIQGRMPGIYLNQNTGVPGSNFKVRIRGTNSIAKGNDPLYVIDGVPFISQSLSDAVTASGLYTSQDAGSTGVSPLNSINPNDIQSIEVLKDADATAIYGSRGANGVILITTKSGKSGAIKLDVGFKTGVSKVVQWLDLLDTKQYLAMRMEAVANDVARGGLPVQSYEYDINGVWDQKRNTQWPKVLLGNAAKMSDVNLSISGGSDGTQFLFSGGYNNQGTVFPGDNGAERISTHFSVTHTTLDKRFNASLSSIYVLNHSNLLSGDLTGIALALAPNAPNLYNSDGSLNWENGSWNNPLSYLENRFKSQTYNLLSNVELGFRITQKLRFKTSIGLNDIRNEEKMTYSSNSINPATNPTSALSRLWMGNATSRSLIIEPQLNYETKLSKSKFEILAGGSYQSRTSESFRETFSNFPSNALLDNPKAARSVMLNSYGYAEYRYIGLFGRLNYNWDGRYILNVTGRRDGSSRFGPGRKFANLGALGAAWIFSNEKFINHIPFLSFGKFRASYGLAGNDQIGDYQFLDTYTAGPSYGSESSLEPSRLYNPDYGWEVNKKLEASIELGFLNDRIMLSAAWYRNRSSNQLINYNLASTTGFSSMLKNLPATVQNTGTEVELTTINCQKGKFKWATAINASFPKNMLVAFPNLASSSYAKQYVIGKPLTISKVYHYLGVNSSTGKYVLEDMNGDGQVTPDDRQALIVFGQRYFGGINNSLNVKSIHIDIFFQVVSQNGKKFIPSSLPGYASSSGVAAGNQPRYVLKGRWQKVGDNAAYQYFSRSLDMQNNHELYYESDAGATEITFMRLKNISISYQLPHEWMRRFKGRLYLQGQNIFTITNYRGLDPETGSETLPPLMTLVAGVQFNF